MNLSEVIQCVKDLIVQVEEMKLKINKLEEMNEHLQKIIDTKEPKTPYDPNWDLLGGGM